MVIHLKFDDGDGPNHCRVKKVDVSSTFIENIFRSGLTLVSFNGLITIKMVLHLKSDRVIRWIGFIRINYRSMHIKVSAMDMNRIPSTAVTFHEFPDSSDPTPSYPILAGAGGRNTA